MIRAQKIKGYPPSQTNTRGVHAALDFAGIATGVAFSSRPTARLAYD
ncbi:hypothetical protein SAMN04487917_105262 [Arthrobacter sp. yr096]|nr:hypothetical protein SAMN04487912_104239 [Arthrobacter sp. cf158]SEJ38434.1 hypothetical protein SAMN04487917_105262 [Arthrobacter sp. yr096]